MKWFYLFLILVPHVVWAGMDIWGTGAVPSITDPKDVPRSLDDIWDVYEKHYDRHNPLEPVVHKTREAGEFIDRPKFHEKD